MAKIYDFPAIKRTNTFRQRLIHIIVDNVPLNVSTYTGKMQLKKDPEGPVIYEFSLQMGMPTPTSIIISKFNVDIPPYRYSYDLKLTAPNGDNLTYIKGAFPVLEIISE